MMPTIFDSANALPDVVIGYVSVRVAGRHLDPRRRGCQRGRAVPRVGLRSPRGNPCRGVGQGSRVLAESRLGKAVAGPPEAFAELTGGQLVARERLMRTRAGRVEYVNEHRRRGRRPAGQRSASGSPARQAAGIEGVVIERPRAPQAIFPAPIPLLRWRASTSACPTTCRSLLGAEEAHRRGNVGVGVDGRDGGQRSVRAPVLRGAPLQGAAGCRHGARHESGGDPHGHGTGESANIFAVAPGAVLRPYRASNSGGALVAALAAFVRGRRIGPPC